MEEGTKIKRGCESEGTGKPRRERERRKRAGLVARAVCCCCCCLLIPLALVDIDARVVLFGVPPIGPADVSLQRDEMLAHLLLARVAQRAHGLRGGVRGELRRVLGLTSGLLLCGGKERSQRDVQRSTSSKIDE